MGPFDHEDETLSPQQARVLIEKEGWTYEGDIRTEIETAFADADQDFLRFVSAGYPDDGHIQRDMRLLQANLRAVLIDDNPEYHFFELDRKSEDPRHAERLEMRLGRGRILKIKPTLKGSIAPLVAVASSLKLAIATDPQLGHLLGLGALAGAGFYSNFLKTILGAYEKLRDPREVCIYEVLCIRQAVLSPEIVNHDAYREKDLDRAVAHRFPTKDGLANAISNTPDCSYVYPLGKSRAIKPDAWRGDKKEWFTDFEAVLEEMVKRQVLTTRNGRYYPTF
ncbi:hypothetical protein J7376_00490 [Paracoccus sp. R12_1]|uniref:hypothetical protein n=1 Tax=unclassified Paracoccus (in: a-proteobacteria) TaxID=2688777 RepID=UPI001ADB271A|nr:MULTISPECIES: hypothetical protein [unclassified Paracoccus (in: a-proteobacteria)]MBO9454197.1 hypothetical protein [Paracoccus sp. R12_2]MBO9484983.1 hypothetical protein [Paracoccus sp. R12_1]